MWNKYRKGNESWMPYKSTLFLEVRDLKILSNTQGSQNDMETDELVADTAERVRNLEK